tara:strand:+ start:295 stop:441 length:147 start_codon:yes stop_codon:yes gene_type:complete
MTRVNDNVMARELARQLVELKKLEKPLVKEQVKETKEPEPKNKIDRRV